MSETTLDNEPAPSRSLNEVHRGLLIVLAVAIGYACLHAGFRLLASNVLGEDDVTDIILSQDLRAGYDAVARQPPLYNWVLWGLEQLMGPSLETFLAIKYAALVASAGFLYLSARRAIGDPLFALLTVESLALIYSIAWRYHEGFTHETGAMVAVLATTWLLLRIVQDGGNLNFVWLGLTMGLGFLTEPAYIVFLVSMLAAASLQSGLRTKLFEPRLGAAIIVATLIASPYWSWLLEEPRRMAWLSGLWSDGWSFNWDGSWDAFRGPFAYLAPLVFILPVIFPGWLKTALADLKTNPLAEPEPNYELFILHAGLIALFASIFGALVFEISGLAVHVLMPLYLATVIWLFGVARRSGYEERNIKWFGRIAIAIALVAFFARMANLYIMDPVCKKCRWGIPYAVLAEEMRDRGFVETGTIVSLERELSGNLRARFPDAKLVARGHPSFTPEGADWTRGRVAYVWDAKKMTPERAQRFLRLLLPKDIRASDAERLSIPWSHLFKPKGYRTSDWYLLIVDKGKKKRVINSSRERRLGL